VICLRIKSKDCWSKTPETANAFLNLMNHDATAPDFPKKNLALYASMLSAAILLGAILNLCINGTAPPTSPITTGDLLAFQASIRRTQPVKPRDGIVTEVASCVSTQSWASNTSTGPSKAK
jgi:hypothetical protein